MNVQTKAQSPENGGFTVQPDGSTGVSEPARGSSSSHAGLVSFDGDVASADVSLEAFGPAQKRAFDKPAFAMEADFLKLQSGILAVTLEVRPKQSAPISLRLPADISLFGSVQKGGLALVLPDLGRQDFKTADWFVLRGREIQFFAKEPFALLLFAVESQTLAKFLSHAAPAECTTLRCFTCPQLREPSLVRHASGAHMHWMAGRIQLSENGGLDHRLTLESHCLEWLRELFRQPQLTGQKMCGFTCTQREESALRQVAAYLDAHLDADHTLDDLSRRFSLNQFKLKCGFKTLFGVTVFGYLRNQRVQRAEQLLQETDCSVLEIANAVGYSNPSHFARNFSKKFGLLPKSYQRLHRRGR